MTYQAEIINATKIIDQNGSSWNAIDGEYVARMRMQNRF